MIMQFCNQKIESIQKDRMVKTKFAIQCALYKATGSCDWVVEIADDVIIHQGVKFYELDISCGRTNVLNHGNGTRSYQNLRFKICGEELTLKDIFTEAVGIVRKWAQ